jgi:hypothetical protein
VQFSVGAMPYTAQLLRHARGTLEFTQTILNSQWWLIIEQIDTKLDLISHILTNALGFVARTLNTINSCLFPRLDQFHRAYAERLSEFVQGNDGGVALPALEPTDVLLAEPRNVGKLLLRQALIEPDPPDVSPHEPPHVHVDGLAGCRIELLSSIVCNQTPVVWWISVCMSQDHSKSPQSFWIDPPIDVETVTDADRSNATIYLRLLDAHAAGVDWKTAAASILRLDPVADHDRAKRLFDRFLARAQWMTRVGYEQLLKPKN